MSTFQARPRPAEPQRHTIEEYRHQAGTVQCTCGWQGASTAWPTHLDAVGQRPRRGR